MRDAVLSKLLSLCDNSYAEFTKKLVPDTRYPILGIRVPELKVLAKKLAKEKEISESFLSLNHVYYEEYFLHALIVAYKFNDLDDVLKELENILPHIDNWAICDSFASALKIFRKHPEKVFSQIELWLKSDKPYVVRFGIVVLICYFLDKNFNSNVIKVINEVKSDNYYVNMAIAWLLSVALIKQYDSTIKLIESKAFPTFIHNKAIQKAIESYRILDKTKNYLRSLKIK